jgi:hypothetical protein
VDILLWQEIKKLAKRVGNVSTLITKDKTSTVGAINEVKEGTVKTIVFVLPDAVATGIAPIEVRFPFDGNIRSIYASCGTSGTASTVLKIEKCSDVDYEASPVWTNIFTTDLTIDAGKKSSKSSTIPYVLQTPTVNMNDHFRVNVDSIVGAKDFVIEVIIEI